MVEAAVTGIQLSAFLERALPNVHRLQLRRLVSAGRVRVNGEVWLASRRLRAGDVVQVPTPAPASTNVRSAAAPPLPEVLFESAHTLVVAKPAGLPTVPDRSGRERGVHGLLADLRPAADLRIVHRLDRDTSGCLVLAKGVRAAQHFDEQFRRRLVRKTYVALVHGVPHRESFAIDAGIGPDRRRPGKVVTGDERTSGFRSAHTDVIRRRAFRRHALLELLPATGRGHQLRVHLQSVGHPIVGDLDYGGERLLLSSLKSGYKLQVGATERPLVDRMFLHCERIGFVDLDGAAVAAESTLPADLAMVLQKIEGFDERRR